MKRVMLIASAAFLLAVGACFGQDIPQSQVPAVVINSFQQSFPKAHDVEWEMKGDLYKVDFEIGISTDYEVWYDQSGKLVKQEEEVTKKDLPAAVQSAITSGFKGYKIDDVTKITADNTVTYRVELKNSTEEWEVDFDSAGKKLSQRAD